MTNIHLNTKLTKTFTITMDITPDQAEVLSGVLMRAFLWDDMDPTFWDVLHTTLKVVAKESTMTVRPVGGTSTYEYPFEVVRK